jgi:hypothetical protein
MKILWLLLAALALAGCDGRSSAAPTREPTGRWAIAPVPNAKEGLYYAWRIDTQSGALGICVYAVTWVTTNAAGERTLRSPECSTLAE